MFEKFRSKQSPDERVESEFSSNLERLDLRERSRGLGRGANAATFDRDSRPEQTANGGEIESVGLEPHIPYEVPLDSRVPSSIAIHDLGQSTQHRTPAARDDSDIMAIIHASDQVFWLRDMRDRKDFMDAKTPYMLVQATTPHPSDTNDPARYVKEIHIGEISVFGHENTHKERFDYGEYVSRNHFRIDCYPDGRISIMDLKSTNGTSVVTASPSKAEMKNDPDYIGMEEIEGWHRRTDRFDAEDDIVEALEKDIRGGILHYRKNGIMVYPDPSRIHDLLESGPKSFRIKDLTISLSKPFESQYGNAALVFTENDEKTPQLHFCLESDGSWYEAAGYTARHSDPSEMYIHIDERNKLPAEIGYALSSVPSNAPKDTIESDLFASAVLVGSAAPFNYKLTPRDANWGATDWFTGQRRPDDQSLVDMLRSESK